MRILVPVRHGPWYLLLPLCAWMIHGCATGGISPELRAHLGLESTRVSPTLTLSRAEQHTVDSARVDTLFHYLGNRAFHEEMMRIGPLRSVHITPGPVLDSGSYATLWNDQMVYLTIRRAALTSRGSLLREEAENLSTLSQSHWIFGLVLFASKPVTLEKHQIILTNSQGFSVAATEIELSPRHLGDPEADEGVRKYRIEGRASFPLLSPEARPIVSENAEWIQLTLLPGGTVQSFRFGLQ